MPRPEPDIAVVGGSIAGLTVALLLQRAGFSHVHVYEAARDSGERIGGALGLGQKTLAILDELGMPRQRYIPISTDHINHVRVQERQVIGCARRPYTRQSTTWPLLNEALREKLPEESWHGGKRLEGLSGQEVAGPY